MPELPEVEIVKRGLAPALENKIFDRVTLNRGNLRFPFDHDFAKRLEGRTIAKLNRRAKFILAELASEGGDAGGLVLAMHLGMTGRFTIVNSALAKNYAPGDFYYEHKADPRHDHVIFTMRGGHAVHYNDVRRFGFMTLIDLDAVAIHPLLKDLGIEPLGDQLTGDYLVSQARDKQTSLKAFLLNQKVIAGLGNIYVCEALFRAGLSPTLPAHTLARSSEGSDMATRLAHSIKAVLSDALAAGGSSLRDYRHTNGEAGSFQDNFRVYGRKGEKCLNECGSTIERLVQQGRSTFYCPCCQHHL